jgi:eukaryotic-like serine/threonine-protein kinase
MKTCPRCNGQFEDAVRFCPRDGIALPEVIDPLVGQVLLGQFEVLQSAGRGAMGTVYRARQTTMDREVAIKVLRKDLLRDPAVIKRFQREARAVARLQHPNIVTVFLIGETPDGRPYLVMEYVDGESLAAICGREGAMPPPRAIGITRQIGSALGEAHAAGVVHRDLKPENIIVGTRRRTADFVKVLDFGIAKIVGAKSDVSQLTRTGAIFGTPHYIAPEQASGGEVDHRADLYSLGVILFRMLTGRLPFDAAGGMQVLLAHIREQPPRPRDLNPELSVELEDVVLRSLAKDPAARWQSADELTAALDRVPELSPAQLPSPRSTWAGVGAPTLAMIESAARSSARTSPINPPPPTAGVFVPPPARTTGPAVPAPAAGPVTGPVRPLPTSGTALGIGAPVPATTALPVVAAVPAMPPRPQSIAFPPNAAELAYATPAPPSSLPSTVAAQQPADDSFARPAPNRSARLAVAALLIVLLVGGAAVLAGYLARERLHARPAVPAPSDAAARALPADAGAPRPPAPVRSNVDAASLTVDGYQLRVSYPAQLQASTDTTFYVDVRDPAGRPLESAKLTLGVRGPKPKDKELKCPGKASALPGRYAAECALKDGGPHRVTVYLRVGGKERKDGFDVVIGEVPDPGKAGKGKPGKPEPGKPKGAQPPAPQPQPPAPQPQPPQPQPQPPAPQPQPPQPQPDPPPIIEPPPRPPELPPPQPPERRRPKPDDIYQLLDGGA